MKQTTSRISPLGNLLKNFIVLIWFLTFFKATETNSPTLVYERQPIIRPRNVKRYNNSSYLFHALLELLLGKLHPSSDAAKKGSLFLRQVLTDRLLHQIVTRQFSLRLLSLLRSAKGRKELELRSRSKILSRFACLIICLSSVM